MGRRAREGRWKEGDTREIAPKAGGRRGRGGSVGRRLLYLDVFIVTLVNFRSIFVVGGRVKDIVVRVFRLKKDVIVGRCKQCFGIGKKKSE